MRVATPSATFTAASGISLNVLCIRGASLSFFISGLCALYLLLPASRDGQGDSPLSQELIDVGRVNAGDVVPITFRLRNTHKRDLQIVSADAECGCTTVSIPTPRIRPGNNVEAKLSLNTTGMRNQVERRVRISCAFDGEEPSFHVLRVRATIVPLLSVAPEVIHFSRDRPPHDSTIVATTRNLKRLTRAYSPHQCIRCSLKSDPGIPDRHEIVVQFDPDSNSKIEASEVVLEFEGSIIAERIPIHICP